MKLFRHGATPSKPEAQLRAGVSAITRVLEPHGFRFVFRKSGNSSGGPFASGEFVRGGRRLELHVRESLGLVRYHLGSHSASHEYYMKELGVWLRCEYPGFPNEQIARWSKNSCDTRIVILEKAAETLPTLNRLFTCRTELARVGKQKNVSLALVIPFPMIMFCERG